jgi:hypothetical protein
MWESDLFKAVSDCFTAVGISLPNCVGNCTDRSAALTGQGKSFQGEAQQIGLHVNLIDSINSRESLASRDIEP